PGLRRALRSFPTRRSSDLRRFPKLLRKVGGYNIETIAPEGHNMASLLVGSEGTLGFFTGIELDLQTIPAHRTLGICHFAKFYDADRKSTRLNSSHDQTSYA